MTDSLPPRCGGSRSAPGQGTLMISPMSTEDGMLRAPAPRAPHLASRAGGGRATRHPCGPAPSSTGSAVALRARPPVRLTSRSRVHASVKVSRPGPGVAAPPHPKPGRRARVCCAAFVNQLCYCRWTLPSQPPPTVDSAVVPPISCPAPRPPASRPAFGRQDHMQRSAECPDNLPGSDAFPRFRRWFCDCGYHPPAENCSSTMLASDPSLKEILRLIAMVKKKNISARKEEPSNEGMHLLHELEVLPPPVRFSRKCLTMSSTMNVSTNQSHH